MRRRRFRKATEECAASERATAEKRRREGDTSSPLMASPSPAAACDPASPSQSVFLFVDNEVRSDAVAPYLEYVGSVMPTVSRFGGRYLCRQGPLHVVPSPHGFGAGRGGRSAVEAGVGGGGGDGCGGSGGGSGAGEDADDDWWRFSTAVMIEFPSRDEADAWIHDQDTMAPLHLARKTHAKSRMLVVEGLPGTWCEERADCPAGSAYVLVDNVVRDAEGYKVRRRFFVSFLPKKRKKEKKPKKTCIIDSPSSHPERRGITPSQPPSPRHRRDGNARARRPSRREYIAGVEPTVAAFGGRYLARGGAADGGGDWQWGRVVLIEFRGGVRAAMAWVDSEDVKPWHDMRRRLADSRMVVLEAGLAEALGDVGEVMSAP